MVFPAIHKYKYFDIIRQSNITSPEVDGVPGEPLDGPGVIIDDVLLGLSVAPAVTGNRGELAHGTRGHGAHYGAH